MSFPSPVVQWRGIAWALLACGNFAVMGVIIKLTAQRFPFHSSELAFWRTLLSVLVLGAVAILQGRRFATVHAVRLLKRSIAGTVSLILFFYCITVLPLATAVTLSYTSSIFLALLSFLLLKERVAPLTVLALVLGLCGVAVLLRPAFAAGQQWGLLAAVGSAALAGYAYLQVRELSQLGEPAWRIVFYFALICTLACALITTLQGWHTPPVSSLPYLGGIGLTALIAQLAMTQAYAAGPKFAVAAMSYVTVVMSAWLAHFFFAESMGVPEFVGMAVIIVAGILAAVPAGAGKRS